MLLESGDQRGARLLVRPFDRTGAVGRGRLFQINQDACLAIVTPLALPMGADHLLAGCLRRNSKMLGKLRITDPDFGHEDLASRSGITVRTGVEPFG